MAITLMSGVTSNSQSTPYSWPGGEGNIQVFGTFDGCTVKLQASGNNGTNYTRAGSPADVTQEDWITFKLAACLIRLDVSSVGTTSVSALLLHSGIPI